LSKDSFEIPELDGAFELGKPTNWKWQGCAADQFGAITRETIQAARLLAEDGWQQPSW